MDKTYTNCGLESGTGMFVRMKQLMQCGVDNNRLNMFDVASRSLIHSLEELQVSWMFDVASRSLIHSLEELQVS